jgi:hypothetical protein
MIEEIVRGVFGRASWYIRAWWYNSIVLWWKYERTGTPRPMWPKIGMKDIVYAPLSDDSSPTSGLPTYGSIKDIEKLGGK